MSDTDAWTREQQLLALMRLPWDVQISREEDDTLIARVTEISDAIATGADEKELAADLWESLYAGLAVRVDHGDRIPLPAGRQLPWVEQPTPRIQSRATKATVLLVREAYVTPQPVGGAAARDFALAG